jgi:hypothetical protein
MRIGNILSTIALGALLVAPMARAEESGTSGRVTKFENTVSVNPLGLAFGSFNANWEHKMGPSHALDVAASFFTYSSGYVKTSGFGVGAGYKMWFNPVAFDGWYWEPRLDVGTFSEKVDILGSTGSASAIGFSPAVVIGREWVWEGGFLIDLAVGLQYYILNLNVDIAGVSYGGGFSGILPTGKFSLGYAF